MREYIYRDRFFIEDDDFYSLDYFAGAITKDGETNWVQLDIGGTSQQNGGVSWGFNLDDKESRRDAIKHFANIYIGMKNFYEKLQEVCKEIEAKEEK